MEIAHPTEDEKVEAALRVAVSMHLEANRKVGKLGRVFVIVGILLAIYFKSLWPIGIAIVLTVASYFWLINSCVRFVQRQTGMPADMQALASRRYKSDPKFKEEVDEFYKRSSEFARHV